MQLEGFDYAYDKRLYDRLREQHARPIREHFHAGLDYQDKLARFLENHDEPRAAATFTPEIHEAAAVITFLSPGLRFFHHGQFEDVGSASPRTWFAGRRSEPTIACSGSTTGCCRRSGARPFATESGSCCSASRRGTATGRGTASWRSPGAVPPATSWSPR
jgi:hypothetical protein